MAYFVLILKGFALVVIYFAEIYSQYPIKNPLNLVQSKYMADVGFSIRENTFGEVLFSHQKLWLSWASWVSNCTSQSMVNKVNITNDSTGKRLA